VIFEILFRVDFYQFQLIINVMAVELCTDTCIAGLGPTLLCETQRESRGRPVDSKVAIVKRAPQGRGAG
jgi:hypothetical protein